MERLRRAEEADVVAAVSNERTFIGLVKVGSKVPSQLSFAFGLWIQRL